MWFIRGVIEATPKRRLSAHTKQQSFKLWREKAKKQKPEALHKHRSKIWNFFFASLLWLCTVATIHMKHIMTCKAGFLLFDSNKYAYKVSSMHLVLNNLLQFHTFPFHSANAVRAFPPFISSEPLGCRELLIRFFRRWCHRRILDLRVNECICLWLVHNLSYARVFNRFFFFPIAVFQSAKAIQNGLNIVPAVVNLMRLPWHKSTTKTGFVSLVLFDE